MLEFYFIIYSRGISTNDQSGVGLNFVRELEQGKALILSDDEEFALIPA